MLAHDKGQNIIELTGMTPTAPAKPLKLVDSPELKTNIESKKESFLFANRLEKVAQQTKQAFSNQINKIKSKSMQAKNSPIKSQ